MTSEPALWRRLFDDAAVFPPGNAAFADAVPTYVERARDELGQYVGPFIAPTARWAEFVAALPDTGGPVEVSAIVASAAAVTELTTAVATDPRVSLRSVEVTPSGDVAETVSSISAVLPAGVTAYFEVGLANVAATAAVVHAAGHRVKVRTGGTVATAFPSEADLAEAIATCVRLSLPFKLTAGLHNALRHNDGQTGFAHHGFVNVIVAVAAALSDGPDPAVLAGILAETDGYRLAHQVEAIAADQANRVRELFTSFGTCSVEDPFLDLVVLGLVEPLSSQELTPPGSPEDEPAANEWPSSGFAPGGWGAPEGAST